MDDIIEIRTDSNRLHSLFKLFIIIILVVGIVDDVESRAGAKVLGSRP